MGFIDAMKNIDDPSDFPFKHITTKRDSSGVISLVLHPSAVDTSSSLFFFSLFLVSSVNVTFGLFCLSKYSKSIEAVEQGYSA